MMLVMHEFDLPLRHPFTISRESYSVQPTVIVELQENEQRGFGESTTNGYYGVTTESLRASIDSVADLLGDTSLMDTQPDQLWQRLNERLSTDPFAMCAIDQAAHDLWGKLHGKSVAAMWGLTPQTSQMPASCFTIGIDSIETMVSKLKEMPGWPIYKIKLGTSNDVQIIESLREQTDALFRVDANCGWQVDEALRNAEELKPLGVEFIEQPLKADSWEGHKVLYDESVLPIIADESCVSEADVKRCAGHFHGVNVKLVKCGGLTPARRMIAEAKGLGMKVMVGCMTESTVGISAIAQLLPLLDYVDMDGACLLSEDIATGVQLNNGICSFSSTPGTGAALLS